MEARLLMASRLSHEHGKFTWFIDKNYTSHMAKYESSFSSLDKSFKTSVKLGDEKRVRV